MAQINFYCESSDMIDNFNKSIHRIATACLVLATACLHCTGLLAQPAQQTSPRPKLEIRHLYIPTDQLDAVWKRDRAGAVLSREEFANLVAAVNDKQVERPLAQGASLTAAAFSATVDGEQLVAEALLEVHGFEDQWTIASFSVNGWSIEQALLDDQPAPIRRQPEAPHVLEVLLQGRAKHELKLRLSTPLAAVGADRVAQFDLPNAATGTFTITVPEGKHVLANDIKVKPAANNPLAFTVAIGGRKQLQLRISDQQRQSQGDVLTFATTAYGVNVSPGEVTWVARTNLQIVGQPLTQLVCTVPKSLEITGVESAGLESWELGDTADDAARTSLTLHYRVPFDGAKDVTITGIVSAQPDGTWTVPNLIITNISAHVGRLVMQHPAGVRLQTVRTSGAQATIEPQPTPEAGQSVLNFQIWKQDFDVAFRAQSKDREVQAAMTNILDVHARGIELHSTVDFQTRFAPLFEAQLRIPVGWEVTGVSIGNQPSPWEIIPQEAGINEVRVALNPPLLPGETRTIAFTGLLQPEEWPIEQNSQRVAIPEVRLPQSSMVEALYGVVADADLEIIPQDVTGLDPARQTDIDLLNQRLAALGKPIRLGYAYQDTVFSGELEISRKPASLSAESITFYSPGRETLTVVWEAGLQVFGGGLRELQVAVSETAGADLRFYILPRIFPADAQQQLIHPQNLPRIVEQTSAEPANGQRLWTLKLDRYVQGEYVLSCVVQTPRGQADAGIIPHYFTLQGADRQSGYVAVEATADQYVQVTAREADGSAMREVDAVDFPKALYQPRDRVVAGFHFLRPGWQIAIADQVFDRGSVPTAVAHNADIASALGKNGTFQHKASVDFTAVGIQSLILQLPPGADLWSTTLDGEPIEVRRIATTVGDGTEAREVISYQIPLKTREAGARRRLEMLYETRVAQGQPTGFAEQSLAAIPPILHVRTGAGADEPLIVLQQQWTLHHPHDAMITSSNGLFEPTLPLGAETFLGELQRSLRVPSSRDLVNGVVALAIAFVVLYVLRVLRRLATVGGVAATFVGLAVVGLLFVMFLVLATPSQVYRGYDMAGGVPATPASPTSVSFDTNGEAVFEEELRRPSSVKESADREFYASDLAAGVESEELKKEEVQLRLDDLSTATPMDAPQAPALETALPPAAAEPDAARRPFSGADPFMLGAQVNDVDGFMAQNGAVPNADLGGTLNQSDVSNIPFPAEPQAAARPRIAGALLSLTMNLDVPERSRSTSFSYRGDAASTGEVPVLHVRMMDRQTGRTLLFAVAAGVLLVGWWLRRAGVFLKGLWFTLTVGVPLAVAVVAPIQSHLILEGLLAGGIGTVLLWCVCGLTRSLRRRSLQQAAMVMAMLFLTGSATFAQDTLPVVSTEPTVIIPYERGDDPLAADRVIVPPELFRKLWEAAHPEAIVPPAAPVSSLPAELLLLAKLVREELPGTGKPVYHVHVDGRFVVRLFVDGPLPVLLPIKGVALESVTTDGQAAALSANEAGDLSVIVQGQGVHVLDLSFNLPAEVVTTRADGTAMEEGASAGQYQLQLHPVLAGTLSIAIPAGPDLQYRVNGSTGTYRIRAAEMGRSLEVPIDRGGTVTVSWQPREQVGGAMETVQVDTGTAVVLDDTGLSVNSGYLVRVRQGRLNDSTFTLPADVSLRSIAGPDVAGWEQTQAEGGKRTLRVFFRRTVEDETRLNIDLFRPLAVEETSQQVEVPFLEPQGITREIGSVAVYALEQYQVRTGTTSGLAQVDAGTVAPPVTPTNPGTAPLYVARHTLRPIAMTLQVSRRQPQTRATVEHAIRIGMRKLLAASSITLSITGAPRKSAVIALPEGFLPIDVKCPVMIDWFETPGENGQRLLTVEFDQPRLGDVRIILEGHFQKSPEDAAVTIRVPTPLSVAPMASTLGVWIDPTYSAAESSSGNWRSLDPNALPDAVKQVQPTPAQFAYRTTETTPGTVSLTTQRAESQLAVDAITLIAVSEAEVNYGFTFRWKITGSTADTFSFTTPDWLQQRLEFTAPGQRQVTSSVDPDGRIRWTITLIDPVKGEYLATAAATVPARLDTRVLTPDLAFDRATVQAGNVALEVQRQFAILVNLSPAQIVQDNPAQFEPVSRSDLPLVVQEELLRQAVEIARVRTGNVPNWRVLPLEAKIGSQATVVAAELQTVLETDGSWRTRATYAVRNRGKQFLPVRIPADARILSVMVRGEPSRTVTTALGEQTIHLVPLPQTSVADLSFEVQLILEGRLPRSLGNLLSVTPQRVELPAPGIVSQKESAQFGMPVAQTSWNVHVPDGVEAAPVSDVRVTNMTWGEGGSSWLSTMMLQQERYRADLAEMLRVARDKSLSSSQRTQARNNLRQINLSLQSMTSSAPEKPVVGKGVELYSEAVEDNRQLQEEASKAITELEKEDLVAQQAPQTQNGREGKNFILYNNDFLANTNSTESAGVSAGDAVNFRFYAFDADVDKDGVADVQAKSLDESKGDIARGKLKMQLGQQNVILGNSISGAYGLPGQGQQSQQDQAAGMGGAMGGMGEGIQQQYEGGADYGRWSQSRGGRFDLNEQESRQETELNRQMLSQSFNQDEKLQESLIRRGRFSNQMFDPRVIDNTHWSAIADRNGDPNDVYNFAWSDLLVARGERGATQWTSSGGLSLPIDVPVHGEALTFSKVGGDPLIMLSVRPKLHWTWLLGAVWGLGWLLVVLGSCVQLFRTATFTGAALLASNVLIAVGLAGFFFLPGLERWLLFAAFCLGGTLRALAAPVEPVRT